MGGKSLPYLRRVKCLIGTGSQYIGIGETVDTDTKFLIDFEADSYTSDVTFGSYYSTAESIRIFLRGSRSCYLDFGLSRINADFGVRLRERCLVEIGNCYVENKTTGFFNETTPSAHFDNAQEMYFFYCQRNGSVSKGKIYGLEVIKGDDVVRREIPVIDYNGKPCLYDEITNQFFYNQGTGEFSWGELDAA